MSHHTTDLAVLLCLHQQPGLSLRMMSQALGISLGKAHYSLQALVERGWVRNRGSQRVLTAAGLRARVTLTRDVLAQKQREVAGLRSQISALRRELARVEREAGEPCKPKS
jgi:DNA-binding IclR family transcriptional regulator